MVVEKPIMRDVGPCLRLWVVGGQQRGMGGNDLVCQGGMAVILQQVVQGDRIVGVTFENL